MRPRAAVWNGSSFRIDGIAPPRLSPGEVLVAVELATVCGSDRHTVAGRRSGPVPGVLGHEAVGRVVAVGPGATVDIGSRVVWGISTRCGTCSRCRGGLPQKCRAARKYGHEALTDGWSLTGAFATHVHLLAGTEIVTVDDDLDARLLAPLGCATATVTAAARRGALTCADTVGVLGCGMLGLTAVAYARDAGVGHVVAVDPDPARRAQAMRLGATVACAPDGAHETADPDGLDVVLEMSGVASSVGTAIRLAAMGGRVVLAGSVVPSPAIPVDPEDVVRRMLTLTGTHNYAPADLHEAVAFVRRTAVAEQLASLTTIGGGLDALATVFAASSDHPRVGIAPRDRSHGASATA